MLFSELYSAYYNAVAAVLKDVLTATSGKPNIREIAEKHAFGESFLTIEASFKNGSWPLLRKDGTTPIRNEPQMPLTLLQKQWLKAIGNDPRIKLFTDELPDFPDVTPLFTADDVCVFDKYADGDDYTNEEYIRRFRLILDAVKNRYPLKFNVTNRRGTVNYFTAQPEYIEYSEKDDKFRVYTSGCRYGDVINIGRIVKCAPSDTPVTGGKNRKKKVSPGQVVLEVTDGRNALERVLLHFAHFEKEAEKIDDKRYRVTVKYEPDDETEILIRVLSFGQFVKVTEPESFIELIKNRLKAQKSCGLM